MWDDVIGEGEGVGPVGGNYVLMMIDVGQRKREKAGSPERRNGGWVSVRLLLVTTCVFPSVDRYTNFNHSLSSFIYFFIIIIID